jgi:prepilin-type N-terminal cleavage/methylation domain-containing protein
MMDATAPRRARRRAGFSMIEMMFAMVILAGGLLAMLTAQIQALKQGKYGRHTTEAMQVARDQMELLVRLPWTDASVAPQSWTAPAAVTLAFQNDQGAVQQQQFNVSYRVTAAGGTLGTELRFIDVDVQWNEAEADPAAPPRRFVLSSTKKNESDD